MFGTIGVQEMVVIFILALVLFGPKKLPELGRTIGKALTEFRRASNDLKASFEREMHNLEREAELDKTKTEIKNALPAASEYEYPYNDYGDYSAETYPNTATNSTTVSASENSSAESHETEAVSEHHSEAVAVPPVEGTVPRSEPTTQPG
ncbi:MAG TPA: twin-arginine translocase TatA/TatE family subunit [Bryobacteraceae bacterium]|jgi:sec-independent protein translocase protein TatA|nr:twin-arginine translocase TatA/TatE family subunit [Bryobacteraceae bacterium]